MLWGGDSSPQVVPSLRAGPGRWAMKKGLGRPGCPSVCHGILLEIWFCRRVLSLCCHCPCTSFIPLGPSLLKAESP